MKNWKSTGAFITFVCVYVYSVYTGDAPLIVDTTGTIALYSSLFMMFRADFNKEMLAKLVDNIKIGK